MGKGSKPRSCFSKKFKNNFDDINWSSSQKPFVTKKGKKIFKYK